MRRRRGVVVFNGMRCGAEMVGTDMHLCRRTLHLAFGWHLNMEFGIWNLELGIMQCHREAQRS